MSELSRKNWEGSIIDLDLIGGLQSVQNGIFSFDPKWGDLNMYNFWGCRGWIGPNQKRNSHNLGTLNSMRLLLGHSALPFGRETPYPLKGGQRGWRAGVKKISLNILNNFASDHFLIRWKIRERVKFPPQPQGVGPPNFVKIVFSAYQNGLYQHFYKFHWF
jgi:hypothetical protein